jgi:hypothetical protein
MASNDMLIDKAEKSAERTLFLRKFIPDYA